jgi:hypothetical protein
MNTKKILEAIESFKILSSEEKQTFLCALSVSGHEFTQLYPKESKPKAKSRASKRGTFACEHCEKVFSNTRGLGIHESRQHGRKKSSNVAQ